MDAARKEELRNRLEELAERLHADAKAERRRNSAFSSAEEAELSSTSLHLADRATPEHLRIKDALLADNEDALARQVAAALQRLDQGGYGVCGTCGDAIDDARLQAVPYAEVCLVCVEVEHSRQVAGQPAAPRDAGASEPHA